MGSCAGFASGMLNMYTTGISQNIVGLPIFSGIEYRFICFLVFFTVGLISVLLYCRMITKNPEKSYVSDEYLRQLKGEVKIEGVAKRTKMNGKHIFALALFIIFLVIQGYCCAKRLGTGAGCCAGSDLCGRHHDSIPHETVYCLRKHGKRRQEVLTAVWSSEWRDRS